MASLVPFNDGAKEACLALLTINQSIKINSKSSKTLTVYGEETLEACKDQTYMVKTSAILLHYTQNYMAIIQFIFCLVIFCQKNVLKPLDQEA